MKRRSSAGLVILIIFLLLLLALIIGLVWAGLMPGISTLFGTNKPRDLGVRASAMDFQKAIGKVGFTLNNQPDATDPAKFRKVYSGQVKVDQTFTQEELSALLTYNHVTWWPIENVQVKVNSTGVMEAAGSLITKNFPTDLPQSVWNHLPKVLPAKLPFYLKGRLLVTGPTTVKLDLQKVELGRIPLPASVLSAESQQRGSDYLNNRIRGMTGVSIQEITYQDGKVRFIGTWPKEFKRVAIGQ